MLGDRELTFDQYVAIIKRRLWWILIPPILLPGLVYLGSLLIPNRYTSTSLVLVEEQEVPENFVKPVVSEQLIERLQTMQQQIFSRTRLQPLIERYGLFASEAGKVPMERLVDEMRSDIAVSTAPPGSPGSSNKGNMLQLSDFDRRRGDLPAFYVSFTAARPDLAQQVCAEITSMFIQEDLRSRQQSAQGTTDFLTSQLQEAKRKLDEEDATLAAFKAKHIGQLPGDEQSNVSLLNTLNTQLETANQAHARAEQEKAFAQSLLAQQLAVNPPTQPGHDRESLQKQLAALQAQLADLQTRYTSEYPDVVRTKNEIERVQRALQGTAAAAPGAAAHSEPVDSPEVQQLRLQIHQLDIAIAQRSAEQDRLQEQIRQYQSRIQMTPKVEEEYKALTRGYDTALGIYNDLLAKRSQSAMATDLERRQEGEQFRVLDPANLPDAPTWPVRWKFSLAGLAAGLGLGVGCVFLLEMRDKTVRTEADVVFYLQLPVLTQIPVLVEDNGADKPSRRWLGKKSDVDEVIA